MNAIVTHIAGYPVLVGSRGRQLCAWCGHELFSVDYNNIAVPINADGSVPLGPRPWEVGCLIEVEVSGPVRRQSVIPHVNGEALPLNCCAVEPQPLKLVPNA